jgi:SAM-dependent methyltransferase
MQDTECAICENITTGTEVVSEHLRLNQELVEIFSARRLPDRITFRWIRCDLCGLLRASPISNLDLSKLYLESSFDYESMVAPLTKTYLNVIKKSFRVLDSTSVLEVGGGNGFMLDALSKSGLTDFLEIEPSQDAFSKASDLVKDKFYRSMFDKDLILNRSFDLIFSFHVFDHLADPENFLRLAHSKLNKNGRIILVMHNENSLSAKILGRKSPIFDIEHRYLFNQKTLRNIVEKSGLSCEFVKILWNCITLDYLVHLLPLPKYLKERILVFFKFLKIDSVKLWLPLGNMYASIYSD